MDRKHEIWKQVIKLFASLNMAAFSYLGAAVWMIILYPPENFNTFIEGVFIGLVIMRLLIAIVIRCE